MTFPPPNTFAVRCFRSAPIFSMRTSSSFIAVTPYRADRSLRNVRLDDPAGKHEMVHAGYLLDRVMQAHGHAGSQHGADHIVITRDVQLPGLDYLIFLPNLLLCGICMLLDLPVNGMAHKTEPGGHPRQGFRMAHDEITVIAQGCVEFIEQPVARHGIEINDDVAAEYYIEAALHGIGVVKKVQAPERI